jgi:cytochrome c oxidase subunit 1
MFGGSGFAFFAGIHYWFPKMLGKKYNSMLANLACIIMFIGFNTLYFPMFIMGWQGMPRRYYDFPAEFAEGQLVATIGSWLLAAGLFIMFYNLYRALVKGEKAEDNPWDGKGLEWQIPSPPPEHNFNEIPSFTQISDQQRND